ncbi:unnamed protein product, partial [marine sediment metagenome]
TYTNVLIEIEGRLGRIETRGEYQDNHLANIDQHLNKLNERTGDCEVATAKNTTRIHIAYWASGTLFSGGGIALILWIIGVL